MIRVESIYFISECAFKGHYCPTMQSKKEIDDLLTAGKIKTNLHTALIKLQEHLKNTK